MPGEYYDVGPFIEQANHILEQAQERGLTLRLLGAIAFHLHCPKYSYIQLEAKRAFTDLDFMSYSEQKKGVHELFAAMGYISDRGIETIPGLKRSIFHSRNEPWHSDIFYDVLEFCHDIDLRGRLELDYPTLPLADLVLEKMQIVKLNEKDAIDTLMLFREHQLGDRDDETINIDYLARVLKSDWGFWRTVTANLQKVAGMVGRYDALTDEDRRDIVTKIEHVLQRIEDEPPTLRWRLRSSIGERIRWYREVDEVL